MSPAQRIELLENIEQAREMRSALDSKIKGVRGANAPMMALRFLLNEIHRIAMQDADSESARI